MATICATQESVPYLLISGPSPRENDIIILRNSFGGFRQIFVRHYANIEKGSVYGLMISTEALFKYVSQLGLSDLSLSFIEVGQNDAWHTEPVSVDSTYIGTISDFIRAVNSSLNFLRAEELAVFTHAYNEGLMLKLWESHYSRVTSSRNLYVIDDGSTDGSIDNLNASTNVIRIPRMPVDHFNMAAYCGYFQRFLLQRFTWVLSTDVDELLFFPVSSLSRNFLVRREPTVYTPSHAIAVVHNKDNELPFDFRASNKIMQSRANFVEEDKMYLKPLLANTPVTWIPGFHDCSEPKLEFPGLVLLHTRLIDANRYTLSLSNWRDSEQKESDSKFFTRISDLKRVDLSVYVEQILSDYALRPKASTAVLQTLLAPSEGVGLAQSTIDHQYANL